MTSTPIHHTNPKGKVTLSPRVFRLDLHHRIYRRPRTFRDRAIDVLFVWIMPAAALVLMVVCWIIVFWVGAAILRAIGR